MLGKIIFKIEGKDLKTVTENVGSYVVSFNDLQCAYSEEDTETVLKYLQQMSEVKAYLGAEKLPDENLLKEILRKSDCNIAQFSVEGKEIGWNCSIGTSLFTNSCIPNAILKSNRKKIEVKAISKIPKMDLKKVTVSRTPIIDMGDPSENLILKLCKCTDCSAPYGDSVLTKIYDKSKAYRVIQSTRYLLKLAEMSETFEIPLSLLTAVEIVLKEQEGVIADTNILRLRLRYLKCRTDEISPFELKMELKKLIRVIEQVFGKKSFELLELYCMLKAVNVATGCFQEAINCDKKISNFATILSGDVEERRPRTANLFAMFSVQQFLRETLGFPFRE